MTKYVPEPVHAWLVMLKAMHAIGRFARSDIEKGGYWRFRFSGFGSIA